MGKINSIKKQTDNRYVNLYNVKATSVHDTPVNYFVASRAKDVDSLKITTRRNDPDGVIIYAIYGEAHDKVVLIRQYRYTLGDYIYEFPAGLVEPDENYHEGAIRELYEETGLSLSPIQVPDAYQKPYFTTVGMTDESCATVYGYASGAISTKAQEDTEEIEVVLADRQEVKRLLKEEKVAIVTAYMLMHFLKDKEPFAFLDEIK
ncbi:MAG: NUDIX hydrolase [Blautia sp.]